LPFIVTVKDHETILLSDWTPGPKDPRRCQLLEPVQYYIQTTRYVPTSSLNAGDAFLRDKGGRSMKINAYLPLTPILVSPHLLMPSDVTTDTGVLIWFK